jgi:steroid 5-alpha reductase family enzyme
MRCAFASLREIYLPAVFKSKNHFFYVIYTMHSVVHLLLVSLAVICSIMFIIWIWGTSIHNYSIVDVFWALNFAVIAGIIYFLADGNETRKTIVCALALLWSLRLGSYLTARVFSHLDVEEGRYKQLRKEWSKNLNLKFFFFFQSQALSNVLLALPYFIIATNKNPEISIVEYIGAIMWLISIIGEGVSDLQLKQFKKDPANKGKVCSVGLWNYSRHPNYFFQLMIWISVLIFALPSPYGWIAIICPLSIGYLIFKVTGIPMTEEQSIRSKGDLYREYQCTTSVFIPWFRLSPKGRLKK